MLYIACVASQEEFWGSRRAIIWGVPVFSEGRLRCPVNLILDIACEGDKEPTGADGLLSISRAKGTKSRPRADGLLKTGSSHTQSAREDGRPLRRHDARGGAGDTVERECGVFLPSDMPPRQSGVMPPQSKGDGLKTGSLHAQSVGGFGSFPGGTPGMFADGRSLAMLLPEYR